jgi:dienelactone hydrolase
MPADVAGHWYLDRDGQRITLLITRSDGQIAGNTLSEAAGATANPIMGAGYARTNGLLQFQVVEPTGTVTYLVQVTDGVLEGRYAVSQGGLPAQLAAYTGRVTGWRGETFQDAARVWDVLLDQDTQAVLRVDRAASDPTVLIGTLKPYSTDGLLDERPSEDVEVQQWDGQNLTFTRPAAPGQAVYTAVETGRTLAGTVTVGGGAPTRWSGTRVEVLTHGLGVRSAREIADWQTHTRTRLSLLAFGGNPQPFHTQVSELSASVPIPLYNQDGDRDDDVASWPQNYLLHELSFDSTLASPWDGESLPRHAHGYLAIPTTPPPPGGYPVVLAMNGHGGSAYDTFDPQGLYWYGDSFARRGFMVLAIDIGHRPLVDRKSLYGDYTGGDDPSTGNGTHPAIEVQGMSSDWEEDGERAWDAMRGLDDLLGRSDVNQNQVVAVGLSMGGEVTDWVAAMDPRIGVAFATGNPSDLAVMRLHGNHPCWNWQRADAREYYDPGDLNALVASRVLVRETGRVDFTYSSAAAPFATSKEVVRRAQPAFTAAGGQLIHYLHFDAHAFHVGQFCPDEDAADGVTMPVLQAPDPASPWLTDWASDPTTTMLAPSIFALIPSAG